MIKPLNFDPNKKYPVFMTIYGGPGHNEVTDSWGGMKYMFYQLLAQKGYIVFSVDPEELCIGERPLKNQHIYNWVN